MPDKHNRALRLAADASRFDTVLGVWGALRVITFFICLFVYFNSHSRMGSDMNNYLLNILLFFLKVNHYFIYFISIVFLTALLLLLVLVLHSNLKKCMVYIFELGGLPADLMY